MTRIEYIVSDHYLFQGVIDLAYDISKLEVTNIENRKQTTQPQFGQRIRYLLYLSAYQIC